MIKDYLSPVLEVTGGKEKWINKDLALMHGLSVFMPLHCIGGGGMAAQWGGVGIFCSVFTLDCAL